MEKDLLLIEKIKTQSSLLPCKNKDDPWEWARFGLSVCMHLAKEIRNKRQELPQLTRGWKRDGSPFTVFEYQLEQYVQSQLQQFYSEAGFWGEEKGAHSQEKEILVIIDPIDGTRSFLNGFDSYSLALAVLKRNEVLFSSICAPATGDLGYRIGQETSKLLQLPMWEGLPQIVSLPIFMPQKESPILINIHPSPQGKHYLDRFYKLWERKKIALVKSVSGSPSLSILEAAKGSSVYFNLWSGSPTAPYDLLPAHHILTGSQGKMLDAEGQAVDPWHHEGPFFCSCIPEHLAFIIEEF